MPSETSRAGKAYVAEFVMDVFKNFSEQRQELLEDRMHTNYDAYIGNKNSDYLRKWRKLEGSDWRSNVFVRLTKQKTISYVAQVGGIEDQGGQVPKGIEPTPYPENAPDMPMSVEEARKRCDLMSKKVDDLDVETHIRRVVASSRLEMGIYGWSWLHYPVLMPYQISESQFVPPDVGGLQLPPELIQRFGTFKMKQSTVMLPTVQHPNIWDIFWDLEESDPQKGQGIIYRRFMSKWELRQLAKGRGWNETYVENVIKHYENDDDSDDTDGQEGDYRDSLIHRRRNIPVLAYWGRMNRKYVKGHTGGKGSYELGELSEDGKDQEIFTVVAGNAKRNEVIYAPKENTLPLKRRPLYLCRLEDIPHEARGVGVPENVEDMQEVINGLVRCYLDNKKLAANILMAGKIENLDPDTDTTLWPGKWFQLAENVRTINEAFTFFAPPDVTQGMERSIAMFESFADRASNLPQILEGAVEKPGKHTAFEISQASQNANQTIGAAVKNRDEYHFKPVMESQYAWLMLNDPDPSIKGDYTCKAMGSQRYQNQITQQHKILQFAQFALQDQYLRMLTKPLPLLKDFARALNMDPERVIKTEEELKAQQEEIMGYLTQNAGRGNVMPQAPPGEEAAGRILQP